MARATPYPDHSLISSEDVIQSDVYGAGNAVIGEIDHFIIDKDSGRIVYAVLRFDHFLDLAESRCSVPWSALRYDTVLGGYRMNVDETGLKNDPKFSGGGW